MSSRYFNNAFSRALGKDNPFFNSDERDILYSLGSEYNILAILSRILILEVSEPNDK